MMNKPYRVLPTHESATMTTDSHRGPFSLITEVALAIAEKGICLETQR